MAASHLRRTERYVHPGGEVIGVEERNQNIVDRVVPELYFLINALLEHVKAGTTPPQHIVNQARLALPEWCTMASRSKKDP
jgi:hypothetical protein